VESVNKISNSIKDKEFLDQMTEHRLPKPTATPSQLQRITDMSVLTKPASVLPAPETVKFETLRCGERHTSPSN